MNKISLYLLLVLTYLGVSKSFSPTENETLYVPNEHALPSIFKGSPTTVILSDMMKVGLIMKTYVQKYLIIKRFEEPKYITVRTNKDYWEKNIKNLGMSIFRRHEYNQKASIVPMPPGFLYIGDPSYGYWKVSRSGKKYWCFYKAYQNLPKLFSYGEFVPSYSFIKSARIIHSKKIPFYGLQREFGTDGSVTQKNLNSNYLKPKRADFNLVNHLKEFFYTKKIKRD